MKHILATDAYKFAMAQAGFPLRTETFYLSFRRGGPQLVPQGLEEWIRDRVHDLAESDLTGGDAFLTTHGYGMTAAMRAAVAQPIEIQALPAGSWVFEREPILTVTGPSFLVSFLEPMLLWLHYPIQLATAAACHLAGIPGCQLDLGRATCEAHRALIETTVGPILGEPPRIEVDAEGYFTRVQAQAAGLVAAVGGDPSRIFEVGMRSAVCMDQHRIALQACKAAGLTKTSNVFLAAELDLQPVGTMGHEHVQRWGSDLAAFRSMRDMRCGPPSYLLDTFDTFDSGLPAAHRAMVERPSPCSIRYDSGDKVAQYRAATARFAAADLKPVHVLEDGFDRTMTEEFERLRQDSGLPPAEQAYGYGGYLVAEPAGIPQSRNRVSAVYKLSETSGEPRMKFGNDAGLGKMSVPGRPVLWRRQQGKGPVGIIGQADELVASGYACLTDGEIALEQDPITATQTAWETASSAPAMSPETQHLIEQLQAIRNEPCQSSI